MFPKHGVVRSSRAGGEFTHEVGEQRALARRSPKGEGGSRVLAQQRERVGGDIS